MHFSICICTKWAKKRNMVPMGKHINVCFLLPSLMPAGSSNRNSHGTCPICQQYHFSKIVNTSYATHLPHVWAPQNSTLSTCKSLIGGVPMCPPLQFSTPPLIIIIKNIYCIYKPQTDRLNPTQILFTGY